MSALLRQGEAGSQERKREGSLSATVLCMVYHTAMIYWQSKIVMFGPSGIISTTNPLFCSDSAHLSTSCVNVKTHYHKDRFLHNCDVTALTPYMGGEAACDVAESISHVRSIIDLSTPTDTTPQGGTLISFPGSWGCSQWARCTCNCSIQHPPFNRFVD